MASDYMINAVEAARLLGVTPDNLKNSRHTKILRGRPTPPYVKLGDYPQAPVKYDKRELLRWGMNYQYEWPGLTNMVELDTEYIKWLEKRNEDWNAVTDPHLLWPVHKEAS